MINIKSAHFSGALFLFSEENKMTRKRKKHPKTGPVAQLLIKYVLGGAIFFAIFIIMAAILPHYSSIFLYVSIPIGIFGFTNFIWIIIRPNLYARLFINISISVLCSIIAFRAFDNLLPQFSIYGGILITIVVCFAYALLIWNSSMSNFIRGELMAPKTKTGKIVFKVSLALIPVIGILGAMIESILHREKSSTGLSIILLFLTLLTALILPFSYRFPNLPGRARDK